MMKKLIYLLFLLPSLAVGQVINPTPDMVFKGQLGAGRGVGTDPSAWFSVGPTVGSVRGVVFPQVSDTNAVISPRRNGLFIWSLQRSRFMYWDSANARWKQIPDISNLDTSAISTRAWRQKGIDSVALLLSGRINGTKNYIAKFIAPDSIGNSQLFDNGNNIGYGTITPANVSGYRYLTINGNSGSGLFMQSNATDVANVYGDLSGLSLVGRGDRYVNFWTNGNERMRILGNGDVTVGSLSGSGTRIVTASPDGTLSTSLSSSIIDTTILSTRAWRQKGDDSLGLAIGQRAFATRNLSINGVQYDLTADRSWSVGTVTSVGTGYGLAGGPVTTSGTIRADSAFITSRPRLQKVADSLALLISNAGGGTVTSVAAGTGMSFPTITSSGSVSVDTVAMSTRLWRQKGIDSINLQFGGKVDTSRSITINGNTQTLSANRTWNVGTVTSVGATGSSGITVTSSPIISSGTIGISADTLMLSTRSWRQKGIDSVLYLVNNLNYDTTFLSTRAWRKKGDDSLGLIVDAKTPLSRTLTINGTAQTLSADRTWNVGTVTSVATGYGLSGGPVTVTGTISADSASITSRPRLQKVADSLALLISGSGGGTVLSVSAGTGMSFPTITSSGSVSVDTVSMSTRLWRQKGVDSVNALVNQRVRISDTAAMLLPYVRHAGFGLIKIPTDAGKTQGLSVDTALVATRAWRQKGDDSLAAIISTKGSGTVTSVTAGVGLTGGTITTTGTVALDTVLASTRAWRQKGDDSLGVIIATKEPTITAGTTAQYWRGDKSWQTLNTTVVPEGTNQYFTNTRARSAISLTTTGSSGAATYDNGTGVFNIPNYTLTGLGGVPTTRLITINGSAQDLSTNRTWNVGTVTGSGDSNYVARFRPGSTVIGTGVLYDNGTRVSIGTTAAASRFHVVTPDIIGQTISSQSALAASSMQFTNGSNATYVGVNSSAGASLFTGSGAYNSFIGSGSAYGLDLGTNSATRLSILSGGQVRVNDLAGTGTRMVVADANGQLSSQAIPSAGGSGTVTSVSAGTGMAFTTITTSGSVSADTNVLSTRAWRQKAVDSLNTSIATRVPSSRSITINGNTQDLSANRTWSVGTVTSVAAGTGMTFTTITGSGTVNADTTKLGTRLYVEKRIDSVVSLIGEIPYFVTDTLIPAGSFKAMRMNTGSISMNTVSTFGTSSQRNVTINATMYIPLFSWSQTGWNMVAAVPSAIMNPQYDVFVPGSQNFYAPSSTYSTTGGVLFSGAQGFSQSPAVKIDGNGYIYANGFASSGASTLSAGGVDYVAVTISITYVSTYVP